MKGWGSEYDRQMDNRQWTRRRQDVDKMTICERQKTVVCCLHRPLSSVFRGLLSVVFSTVVRCPFDRCQ